MARTLRNGRQDTVKPRTASPGGAGRLVPGDLEKAVTAVAAHAGGLTLDLRAVAAVRTHGIARAPGQREARRVLGARHHGPAERRLRGELQLAPRYGDRFALHVNGRIGGGQLEDSIPGALAERALHVRLETGPMERSWHGDLSVRWGRADARLGSYGQHGCRERHTSVYALDGLPLEPRPGLARADPGSLPGRVEEAGVVPLEPLDEIRSRVMDRHVVLFLESPPFLERPVAHVAHKPETDRHVDVDIHATKRARGATPLFGVTERPATEGQVAVAGPGDAEIPGIAAELVRGVGGGTRAHIGNMPRLAGVASRVGGGWGLRHSFDHDHVGLGSSMPHRPRVTVLAGVQPHLVKASRTSMSTIT